MDTLLVSILTSMVVSIFVWSGTYAYCITVWDTDAQERYDIGFKEGLESGNRSAASKIRAKLVKRLADVADEIESEKI